MTINLKKVISDILNLKESFFNNILIINYKLYNTFWANIIKKITYQYIIWEEWIFMKLGRFIKTRWRFKFLNSMKHLKKVISNPWKNVKMPPNLIIKSLFSCFNVKIKVIKKHSKKHWMIFSKTWKWWVITLKIMKVKKYSILTNLKSKIILMELLLNKSLK